MSARFAAWMRCNLSLQGYEGLSDEERRRLGVGLRLAPALCLAGMALGVLLGSPALLLAMAATALLGGFVTAKHPFDAIWDHGLRRLVAAPPLPPTPAPRRLACQLASVWLVALAAVFYAGNASLGLVLGAPLVLVAAVVAATNWCLPSFLYRSLLGSPVASGAKHGLSA